MPSCEVASWCLAEGLLYVKNQSETDRTEHTEEWVAVEARLLLSIEKRLLFCLCNKVDVANILFVDSCSLALFDLLDPRKSLLES